MSDTVPDRNEKWRPRFAATHKIAILVQVILVVGFALARAGFTFAGQQPSIFGSMARQKTVVINGARQWVGDKKVTAPISSFSPSDSEVVSVSPLFARYYQSHGAAKRLGEPVTVAFPTKQGWLQFFEAGALLLPAPQQATTARDADDALAELVKKGTKDPVSGIVSLPLFQELLTVGSQVPVGVEGSSLTYVDLRKATAPHFMLPASTTSHTIVSSSVDKRGIFVKGGMRGKKAVGHFIAQSFWDYINRRDSSPDGWMKDFGVPLTEALPFTITNNGSTHHMLVQAFSHAGLILDQDAPDASSRPTIQLLDTGTDYLQTFGPPPVALAGQQTVWAQGETTVLKVPCIGNTIAHVGQNFAFALLGETDWVSGMLWYHVQWSTPKNSSSGWVPATAIIFTSPGNVAAWASFDALSPSLAAYLASHGSNIGAVVYNMTHQRYYTYNSDDQFIVASSMKVPIMVTFLDMLEQQGREPDDQEMNLLRTMIENSNNDSASTLYYDEIGGAAAVASYMQKIGIKGLSPSDSAWGYSLITPQAMVNLLTYLQNGKILTASDRALALNLMENIEADQQVGVGDTAPAGASVAMKDGWVTGPDTLWAMNTSGIITTSKETYIMSVYMQEQPSLDDGQAIVRKVCSAVASALS